MKVNEIRELLMREGTYFTIEGMFKLGSKTELQSFSTRVMSGEEVTGAIGHTEWYNAESMNVTKFGPSCVTLYSYDMFKNKTVGKFKYADVSIIEENNL